MAKFHIRLKVQGLEVEIDGERQDIPLLSQAIEKQFAGLVLPAEVLTDCRKQLGVGGNGGADSAGDDDKKKRPARRERRSPGDGAPAVAVEFRHDSATYGNPTQAWSVTDKCIWLLYVLKKVAGANEVSGPTLAATFNQYFKPSGKLHPPNVTRDLAKLKVQNPAPIGEDKGNFYLTGEGDKQAEALINAVLNPA